VQVIDSPCPKDVDPRENLLRNGQGLCGRPAVSLPSQRRQSRTRWIDRLRREGERRTHETAAGDNQSDVPTLIIDFENVPRFCTT
jgi:hypothetical protein